MGVISDRSRLLLRLICVLFLCGDSLLDENLKLFAQLRIVFEQCLCGISPLSQTRILVREP